MRTRSLRYLALSLVFILGSSLVSCVQPHRTYNVAIDCQGEGHTVNIHLLVEAPQDYDATAETDATVSVVP